jgi:hypothetical protein
MRALALVAVVPLLMAAKKHAPKDPPSLIPDALVAQAHALALVPDGGLSDEALCARVDAIEKHASKLTEAMEKALGLDTTDSSDLTAEQLEAVKTAAEKAAAPGVSVDASNDEIVDVGTHIDLPKLGQALHAAPAAQAFFDAVAPFVPAYETQSIAQELVTDVTACTTFRAAGEKLPALHKAWAAAPPCLREHYAPAIKKSLAPLEKASCVCEDEAAAKSQAKKLAKALQSFPEVGGVELAPKVRSALTGDDVQFDCAPN